MSVNNGIITSPVSIDDVKNVLGESSNDLATLCKSGNINMWAKYKPTSYAAPFPADWYKAGDGNYGLNISGSNRVTTWSALVAEYAKTNNGYGDMYKRPSGSSSSPYRLGDFRGYNHNANPEIKDYLGVSTVVISQSFNVTVEYNAVTTDGDQLSFTDVGDFKNLYFGYVVLNSSKSFYTIRTASNTVANGDYTVNFPANTFSEGTYYLYPMFCSANYSSSSTLQSMGLYAVPNLVGGKALSMISSSSSVLANFKSITASKNSLGGISVTLTLKDNASSVSGIYVYFCHTSNPSAGGALVSGEIYRSIGTMTAGQTKLAAHLNADSSKQYKIYILAGGSWIIKGMLPAEDIITS